MSDQHKDHAIEAQAIAAIEHVTEAKHSDQLFSPDIKLMILTWIAFLTLLVVLKKFAWKPILEGLQKREEDIRKSVEEADRIHQEMSRVDEKKRQILLEAQKNSELMINDARVAAREAGKAIEKQAKDQAQIILENADRDAKDSTNQAYADLKSKSADMVVDLASKLVRENMTDEKNKKLVAELLKEI